MAGRFVTLVFLLLGVPPAMAATRVVDDDGLASAADCDANSTADPSISAAVAAANPGDTIRVCPGAYEDDVTITKPLTIRGARAGESSGVRRFGLPSESTLTGSFSVQAPHVTIDGFSLSNAGGPVGITVATAGDAARIANNIINGIGDDAQMNNATGIYLERGPDRVTVTGNWISNVVSQPTSRAILVGDSASTDPSLDILITHNLIEDVASVSTNPDLRGGAYGVQVNNGADATGYATVTLFGNVIRRLTGDWAYAIALEGATPGASVIGNAISYLVDRTPDPASGQDAVAVFFENNPHFATARVHYNNFDVTDAAAGIAVNSPPASPVDAVDGRCNWWDSWTGPSAVGPGLGAKVSPNVDYAPWLLSPAPFGRCRGGSTAPGSDRGDLPVDRGDRYDR